MPHVRKYALLFFVVVIAFFCVCAVLIEGRLYIWDCEKQDLSLKISLASMQILLPILHTSTQKSRQPAVLLLCSSGNNYRYKLGLQPESGVI